MALEAKEFNFEDNRMRFIQEQFGTWEPSQHSLETREKPRKPDTS
jgi:hypothetical protein